MEGIERNDVMSARLTVRQVDQVTVVDAAGRITLGEGAGSMRDKISELLRTGKSKILVNLGEVSYIDSSAICELVAALTSVTNRGGQLKLLNLTKKVEGLLQITKLYSVFDVFDSEVTAIRSFGACSAVATR
jgi:anti-sigma B factor antagonist